MRTRFICAMILLAGLASSPAIAKKDKMEEFHPKTVISDGKNGRKWGQFNETLPEKSYYEVRVKMRKVSGGDDTFVNLRFGRDGQTLDNSKRVYLKNNEEVEEKWQFERTKPNGKPLILNAYNGEVEVIRVRAWYD